MSRDCCSAAVRTHSAELLAALWCFVCGSGKWTCHWRLGSALKRQPRTRNTNNSSQHQYRHRCYLRPNHTQSTLTLFLSYSTATVRTTSLRRQWPWPAASKPSYVALRSLVLHVGWRLHLRNKARMCGREKRLTASRSSYIDR